MYASIYAFSLSGRAEGTFWNNVSTCVCYPENGTEMKPNVSLAQAVFALLTTTMDIFQ